MFKCEWLKLVFTAMVIMGLGGGQYYAKNVLGHGSDDGHGASSHAVSGTEKPVLPYKRINSDEARLRLSQPVSETYPKVVVIDIRGLEAYKAGHIPGAFHIPSDGIAPGKRLAMAPDLHQPVMVYGQSPARIDRMARSLVLNGYRDVYNVKGLDRRVDLLTDRETPTMPWAVRSSDEAPSKDEVSAQLAPAAH